MSDYKLTREELDANQRYQERFGDDPAKEFRLTLNGSPLFADECFQAPKLTELELIDLGKRLNLESVDFQGRTIYKRGI